MDGSEGSGFSRISYFIRSALIMIWLKEIKAISFQKRPEVSGMPEHSPLVSYWYGNPLYQASGIEEIQQL